MCCHCQVRQHALHCDSQPIIPDDFAIVRCVPFLHPYLVSGIREDWRDILLSEPVTFFPLARNPKGKEGINTTLGRVGMKGASLPFYEIPPPALRQAVRLKVQTRRMISCKVSASHYWSGYSQIKNAQPERLRVYISKRYNKKCATESATQISI